MAEGRKSGGNPRVVVGISGASGVAYGIRLLEALKDVGAESHLVVTGPGEMTIGYETALTPKAVSAKAGGIRTMVFGKAGLIRLAS